MQHKITLYMTVIIVLLTAGMSNSQTISGVFNSVSGRQTNSTQQLNFTVGESLIGFSNNSSIKSFAGFWYTYNENITTDIEEQLSVPTEYKLEQNYPNPFNPSTTIKFSLPENSMVTLKVYNIVGEEVAILINEEKNSGFYEQSFDASRLASGIYIYRLSAGFKVFSKKMMLIK